MTTQTAVFSGLPTGLTLTKKVFTVAAPDTEVTGITGAVTERTNAFGQYVCAITKAAVISGDHTIILFLGAVPIAIGKRTFAGTDGEEATTTPEVAALDTATKESIADTVLSRNVSNVESTVGEHTLATAILGMLEWEISGNDLIIKRTDGTTVHYTKTLSSATGTGDVITGLN